VQGFLGTATLVVHPTCVPDKVGIQQKDIHCEWYSNKK